MKPTLVGRMLWKEYRAQRGLWLAVVTILVVVQTLVWTFMPRHPLSSLETLMLIGIQISGFYALGSAAVSFAGEREDGTAGWLRILPVGFGNIATGKIVWLLLSSCAVACVAVAFAFVLTQSGAGAFRVAERSLTGSVQTAVAMVLWGLLFSLICRRVYVSLALAAAAVLAFSRLVPYVPGDIYTCSALLVVGNVIAGGRWLRSTGETAFDRLGAGLNGFTLQRAIAGSIEGSPAWKIFRRELWVEWRTARWWLLALTVGASVDLVAGSALQIKDWGRISFVIVFGVLPLICGLNVFYAEQQGGRFRFHANRGASPASIWLAKHAVWLSVLVYMQVLSLIGTLFACRWLAVEPLRGFGLPLPDSFVPGFTEQPFAGSRALYVVGFSMLTYWIAQCCSLLFARPVVAGAVASACLIPAWLWYGYGLVLGVSLTVVVGLPVVLIAGGSLLRMNGWLKERHSVSDRLKLCGWTVLIGAACVTSWAMWRLSDAVGGGGISAKFAAVFPAFAWAGGGIGIVVVFAPIAVLILMRLWRRVERRGRVQVRPATWIALYLILHVGAGLGMVVADASHEREAARKEIETLSREFDASAAARRTGELYQRLGDQFFANQMPFPMEPRDSGGEQHSWNYYFTDWSHVSEEQREWLAEIQPRIDQLVEVSSRPGCSGGYTSHIDDMLRPLRLRALQLESEGRLKEAWYYHRAGLRVVRHMAEDADSYERYQLQWKLTGFYLEQDLPRFAARREQTADLLVTTAEEIASDLHAFPSLERAFQKDGLLALETISDDKIGDWSGGHGADSIEALQGGLLQAAYWPFWEKSRAIQTQLTINQRKQWIAKAVRDGKVGDYLFLVVKDVDELLQPYSYPGWILDTRRPSGISDYSAYRDWVERSPLYQAADAGLVDDTVLSPLPFKHQILTELRFHRTLDRLFLVLGGYATRCKTGEIPGDLGQLVESDSSLAILLSGELAVRYPNGTFRLIVNKERQTTGPYAVDLRKLHMSRFAQSEYNSGSPDDVPLTAPRPTEALE